MNRDNLYQVQRAKKKKKERMKERKEKKRMHLSVNKVMKSHHQHFIAGLSGALTRKNKKKILRVRIYRTKKWRVISFAGGEVYLKTFRPLQFESANCVL